jgi:hypothetical protein
MAIIVLLFTAKPPSAQRSWSADFADYADKGICENLCPNLFIELVTVFPKTLMKMPHWLPWRRALLFGMALNLCLVVIRVWLYRPLWAMPGALRFIVEPIIGLTACALFVVAATSGKRAKYPDALRTATAWGTAGGALLVAHMALENFGRRIGENVWITLAFMFITFLSWGVTGFAVARNPASTAPGWLGGCWSAVVSVLMAVIFGFALMFFAVPSPDYVATWPEFKHSGWNDAQAFAIANSLDAGFTHLVTGLVLGSVFGAIGGGLARLWPKHPATAS